MTKGNEPQIIIYQSIDGRNKVEVRFSKETLWLSQAQLAELFDKNSDSIGLHLKNIYKSGELEEKSTTEQSSVVRQEGNRQVKRLIKFYNLDAIINDTGLAALALLVAESDPKQKDILIRLIMNMISVEV